MSLEKLKRAWRGRHLLRGEVSTDKLSRRPSLQAMVQGRRCSLLTVLQNLHYGLEQQAQIRLAPNLWQVRTVSPTGSQLSSARQKGMAGTENQLQADGINFSVQIYKPAAATRLVWATRAACSSST